MPRAVHPAWRDRAPEPARSGGHGCTVPETRRAAPTGREYAHRPASIEPEIPAQPVELNWQVSCFEPFNSTQKGLKADAPSGIDETFHLKLDYIDIPVLLRLGPTGGSGLQFLVGPSFNFNTNAKVVLEGTIDGVEGPRAPGKRVATVIQERPRKRPGWRSRFRGGPLFRWCKLRERGGNVRTRLAHRPRTGRALSADPP